MPKKIMGKEKRDAGRKNVDCMRIGTGREGELKMACCALYDTIDEIEERIQEIAVEPIRFRKYEGFDSRVQQLLSDIEKGTEDGS